MDLNAPLGMEPPPPSRRGALLVAATVAATVAICAIGFVLTTADPRGGEPFAVAALPPAPATPGVTRTAAPVVAPVDSTPTGSLAANSPVADPSSPVRPNRLPAIDEGALENGVRVYRGTDPASGPPDASHVPLVIDVTRTLDDPLHRGQGATPKVTTGTSAPVAPRVAIFIGGMGLSQSATRTAIDNMPAAVTLAFLPYGATVAASVAAAKAKGHEVLLQLPMQNAGGTAPPGPHTLRPDEPADALAGDLGWLMSRFEGYAGVTNLLGGPVTADASTMRAVLRATGARNLFFVDDGTSRNSVIPTLASDLHVAAAKADVVLDATADPAIVRANLESLISIARRKGQAIGMASGLPDHLGAIASFAASLSSQNVALVPVSALVQSGASVATMTR